MKSSWIFNQLSYIFLNTLQSFFYEQHQHFSDFIYLLQTVSNFIARHLVYILYNIVSPADPQLDVKLFCIYLYLLILFSIQLSTTSLSISPQLIIIKFSVSLPVSYYPSLVPGYISLFRFRHVPERFHCLRFCYTSS